MLFGLLSRGCWDGFESKHGTCWPGLLTAGAIPSPEQTKLETQWSLEKPKKWGSTVQDGAPKIAFSCLISGFMVDITIVNRGYNGL